MEIVNVIMYIFLFIFIFIIWKVENKDIHCPTLTSTTKECEDKGGMSFSGTKPSINDSIDILLSKIFKASNAETDLIQWRRAFIIASCSAIVTWILLGPSIGINFLPDWKILYLSILIIYVIVLGSFMYYNCHVFGIASNWIKESINIIKTKI